MSLWIMENISSCFNLNFCLIFRAFFGLISAFFISLGIGKYVILFLCNLKCFQIIRSDGPNSHIIKRGTPTMGGVLILISTVTSILMWADLSNSYVWYVLFVLTTYGILGWFDDFFKITKKNSVGLRAKNKYFWQSLIAMILIVVLILDHNFKNFQLVMPFFKNVMIWKSDIWYILLIYFVIVGVSNSVNLSDGLDGLITVPIILIAFGLALVSWLTSSVFFSNYLCIPYIYQTKELVVVCFAIAGSAIGFLWFNAHPARIFMGDTGSLSLGSGISIIAILLRQEFLLLIMGSLFIIETMSVIIQVLYFKLFKRRIFKMTPIHHHFELKGYLESQIVIRFWIISFILVFIGLMTLKIR